MSCEQIEEWAWGVKKYLPDQQYIDLMNMLSKHYLNQSYNLPHRVKIQYQTTIKIPSDDWLDNHSGENYDLIDIYDDDNSEEEYIESHRLFNVNLNDIVSHSTDYSIEDEIEGKSILKKHTCNDNYIRIIKNVNLTNIHNDAIEIFRVNSDKPICIMDTERRVMSITPVN